MLGFEVAAPVDAAAPSCQRYPAVAGDRVQQRASRHDLDRFRL
jgi:hypothetical protein